MPAAEHRQPVLGDIALFVALSMAAFAVLFGTRHIDATEHQDGLMLAIATESIVKLVAFLAVGMFVTFWMFDGPMRAVQRRRWKRRDTAAVLTREPPLDTLARHDAAVVLRDRAVAAAIPRHRGREQRRARDQARRLAVSALSRADQSVRGADRDGRPADIPGRPGRQRHVRAGAAAAGRLRLLHASLAFVGGLSAATAMVIVETVALSIMVSNDIVMPLVLQRREALITGREDIGALLLTVRRVAIFVILLLAYLYYRSPARRSLPRSASCLSRRSRSSRRPSSAA